MSANGDRHVDETNEALPNMIAFEKTLIGFDEMNVREWQGETLAYRKTFPLDRYTISRWPHSSVASYIVMD